MLFVRTILLIVLVMQLPTVAAAVDGLLGTESEATTLITFIKQNSVRISGVSDVDLGARSSLASSERYTERLCVYSSTGAYAVTATSINGAFELRSDDAPSVIIYRLQWVSGGARDLQPAVTIGGLLGNSNNIDCNGGQNASFRIIISASNFNSAEPGVYSDTLMLLVRPE